MDYAGCFPLIWFLVKQRDLPRLLLIFEVRNLTKLVEVGHLLSDGEGSRDLHTYYHPDLITRSIPIISQPPSFQSQFYPKKFPVAVDILQRLS